MRLKKMRWAAALLLTTGVVGACSAGGAQKPTDWNAATGGAGGAISYGTGGDTASGGSTAPATGGRTAGHDPTLFSWPEASPDGGAALRCQSGHYVGTYSCDVQGNGLGGDGGIPYPLTGPVDLRLEQSQSGEFLTVSGGTLKSAAGFLALEATLVGTLNCQTGAFSGTLQDGGLAIPPFPVDPNTVGGTLSAVFVESGPKLTGSWTLVGQKQFVGYSCSGPWSATWQAN